MKSLWRKTSFLLRKHPILWAPYFVVALLTCILSWLRRLTSSHILDWIANRQVQSVLGGNFGPHAFDPAAMLTARRLGSALTWVTTYVSASIYGTALVLTAILVGVILCGEQPVFASAATRLRGYPKRILVYSAKAWLLTLVLTVVLSWPIYASATLHARSGGYSIVASALDLLGRFCFAWVIAPIAINLLRPAGSAALPIPDKTLGRYIYMLAAAAQYLIEYLQRPLLPVLTLHSSNAKYPAFYFSPLIAAIPFAFLYVAFAMIADPDLQPRVVPRDSRLGEWLSPFMPLHFHPREEPQTPNEPGSSLP